MVTSLYTMIAINKMLLSLVSKESKYMNRE
jgi:hypothetical protein